MLVAILSVFLLFGEQLYDIFSSPDRLQQLVDESGPLGPLVYMLLQVVQVFFAPVPGQVVGFAGGYLFGVWLGTLYSMIGAAIGFTLIFVLVRRLGRPFVEYFVNAKTLSKFDYLSESRGVFVLFLIFLLPAFPDDLICFIAGLTKIRIRTLIIVSLLGRLPGFFVLSLTGSGAAESNWILSASVLGGSLIVGVVAYWQRVRIERFVHRFVK